MHVEIAKESKTFEQDYYVKDENDQIKAVFGTETEADGYIFVSKAMPVICETMKNFKQNAGEVAERITTICQDHQSVSRFGDFGETERLARKPACEHY